MKTNHGRTMTVAHVRYPNPLRKGSRVFLAAPSSGVDTLTWPRLDLVIENLEARGLVVEEGTCLRREYKNASAPSEERAHELMTALLRDDVDAVLPPWGGSLAIELLGILDWDRLRNSRPKWFAGFSDLSTLMIPLRVLAGWASAHGPNAMELISDQSEPLVPKLFEVLFASPGTTIEQRASRRWQKHYRRWEEHPRATYDLTEPTRWWTLDGTPRVEAQGRLIGGCLDTLMHLAGTPYGDVPRLHASTDDGCIVFLENCGLGPVAVSRALHQLQYAGWFQGINALVLGRSGAPDPTSDSALTYNDAVRQAIGHLDCPVLMDVDVGHRAPQMTLVQGAVASLTWSETDGGSVTQRLV
jgi:muramoyltetrapeptide carboxypeptidase LdcA involved in peptidoglycan recycling